jgi:hypothetical protein
VADGHAEDDDHGMDEFVNDLAFVGHGRRVNGNARIVPAAVQIILKISSNISEEKISRAGARREAMRSARRLEKKNTKRILRAFLAGF